MAKDKDEDETPEDTGPKTEKIPAMLPPSQGVPVTPSGDEDDEEDEAEDEGDENEDEDEEENEDEEEDEDEG